MSNFTHLHVHSDRSLMDGLNTPAELLQAAKDLGQSALAITDHGTLSAHRNMLSSAREAGMKPILGLEAYISPTDRFDRRPVKQRDDNTQLYNHIIILAKDQRGVQNLYELSKKAWEEGYYFKPRIDRELLLEYKDGLIILSGCMNGLIAKEIERGNLKEAENVTRWFANNFEDFYMEIQPHNPVELNHGLLDLADKFAIPPVVTADCHFSTPDLRSVEEAMLILSTSPKFSKEADFSKARLIKDVFERYDYLYPERPISFADIDVYVSDRLDIEGALAKQGITRTDVYENTLRITDSVGDYEYHQGLDLLPKPKGEDPNAILRRKVREGLKKRGLLGIQEYEDRADEELGIIESKNFSSYFLIVGNMVAWARSKGIFVGPGRGSGAGSLVNYALEITDVDPIKYNLLFFRFINPDRNDFPDIDTDFQDNRRGEIKNNYLTRMYKNVASIATYAMFKDKNVIKDAARVFQIPRAEVERALKTVNTFEEYLDSPNTQEFRNKYPEVTDLATALRGRIRSSGMHASGFVVSREPIENYLPIETAKDAQSPNGPRVPLVAADMDEVAEVGMIKLDVLGLKALTIIDETLKAIYKNTGKMIDIRNLSFTDPKIYEDLSNGHTKAIFQAEQPAYTSLLVRMGVSSFAELAASNALVRPGAMNTIGASYVLRKNGHESVRYTHDMLKPFTEETYGCILYQEQVMQTCVSLGGMTMSEADKVRKIIGKKKDVREFDAFKDKFVTNASTHITKEAAEKLWHDFEAHAGYSFNKSHAVAYSMITYWTAWLKHYYPKEFMYAVLKNEMNKESRTDYLIEAKRLGLKVYLPDVNKSDLDFSMEEDGLRFGLADIKYISENIGTKIIAMRPFSSYADLTEKAGAKYSGVNSRAIFALNAVGAATFPDNPKRGNERDNFYEYLSIPSFGSASLDPRLKAYARTLDEYEDTGAFVVIAMVRKIVRKNGWARAEVVDETGSAGIFTDEHTPMEAGQMYVMLVSNNRIARYTAIDDATEDSTSTFIQFLYNRYDEPAEGMYRVVAFNPRTTKAGKKMADAVLADPLKNLVPTLVFPQAYPKASAKMREGRLVLAELRETEDGTVFVHSV